MRVIGRKIWIIRDVLSRLGSALADSYRIERKLGAGDGHRLPRGDLRHDRKVALKVPVDVAAAVAQSLAYRDFMERWKIADPEVQPRVSAARQRIIALTPVGRARRWETGDAFPRTSPSS